MTSRSAPLRTTATGGICHPSGDVRMRHRTAAQRRSTGPPANRTGRTADGRRWRKSPALARSAHARCGMQ